jgi:hypothetical protein
MYSGTSNNAIDITGTTQIGLTGRFTAGGYLSFVITDTSHPDGYSWRFQDNSALINGGLYFRVKYTSGDTYIKGNLGIGTTSPPGKLTVAVSGDAENMLTAAWSDKYFCVGQSPSTSSSCVSIGFNNTTNQGWIYSLAPSVAWRDLNYGAASHSFYCASLSPAVTINSTGNVGIGTTTPGLKLDVVGNLRQSSLPVLYVYKSDGDQTVASGGLVSFNGSNYINQWTRTSNTRFTLNGPTGYYSIRARVQSVTGFTYASAAIYVNGTQRSGPYSANTAGNYATIYNEVVWLLNTNDYIEVFNLSSVSIIAQSSGSTDARCAFQAVYLSGTT